MQYVTQNGTHRAAHYIKAFHAEWARDECVRVLFAIANRLLMLPDHQPREGRPTTRVIVVPGPGARDALALAILARLIVDGAEPADLEEANVLSSAMRCWLNVPARAPFEASRSPSVLRKDLLPDCKAVLAKLFDGGKGMLPSGWANIARRGFRATFRRLAANHYGTNEHDLRSVAPRLGRLESYSFLPRWACRVES